MDLLWGSNQNARMSCSRWAGACGPGRRWGHAAWGQCEELAPEVPGYIVQRKFLYSKEKKNSFFFGIFTSANRNFALSALRLIGTRCDLCVLSLCHILSHPGPWGRSPVNWLASPRSSTARPGKAWERFWGSSRSRAPPSLPSSLPPLTCLYLRLGPWMVTTSDIVYQLSLLPQQRQGHKN